MILPNLHAKQWTEGSIYCYNRGCNCSGCYYKDLLSQPCQMKSAVFTLVKKLGAPPKYLSGTYTKGQRQIIAAILEGYTTKEELAERLNINITNLQSQLNALYTVARAEGCYFPSRIKFDYLINWLKTEYSETIKD